VLDKLARLGASIVEVEIPGLLNMRKAHATIIGSEFSTGTRSLPRHPMSHPTRTVLSIFDNIMAKVTDVNIRMFYLLHRFELEE
jgi:hypothetical protein